MAASPFPLLFFFVNEAHRHLGWFHVALALILLSAALGLTLLRWPIWRPILAVCCCAHVFGASTGHALLLPIIQHPYSFAIAKDSDSGQSRCLILWPSSKRYGGGGKGSAATEVLTFLLVGAGGLLMAWLVSRIRFGTYSQIVMGIGPFYVAGCILAEAATAIVLLTCDGGTELSDSSFVAALGRILLSPWTEITAIVASFISSLLVQRFFVTGNQVEGRHSKPGMSKLTQSGQNSQSKRCQEMIITESESGIGESSNSSDAFTEIDDSQGREHCNGSEETKQPSPFKPAYRYYLFCTVCWAVIAFTYGISRLLQYFFLRQLNGPPENVGSHRCPFMSTQGVSLSHRSPLFYAAVVLVLCVPLLIAMVSFFALSRLLNGQANELENESTQEIDEEKLTTENALLAKVLGFFSTRKTSPRIGWDKTNSFFYCPYCQHYHLFTKSIPTKGPDMQELEEGNQNCSYSMKEEAEESATAYEFTTRASPYSYTSNAYRSHRRSSVLTRNSLPTLASDEALSEERETIPELESEDESEEEIRLPLGVHITTKCRCCYCWGPTDKKKKKKARSISESDDEDDREENLDETTTVVVIPRLAQKLRTSRTSRSSSAESRFAASPPSYLLLLQAVEAAAADSPVRRSSIGRKRHVTTRRVPRRNMSASSNSSGETTSTTVAGDEDRRQSLLFKL